MENVRLKKWLNELKNPIKFFNFAYFRFLTNIFRRRKYEMTSIFSKEWDTLIVLDACRFDVFKSTIVDLENLEKIFSPGSSTPEWLLGNFPNEDLTDIVYISGNPFTSKRDFLDSLGDSGFFKLIDVWRIGWDEKVGTVMPKEINKKAIKMIIEHPDKKIILHYMQPHYPFVGKVKLPTSGMIQESFFNKEIRDTHSVWFQLREGMISKDEAWIAYISNLDFVLSHVNTILPYLPGKVCVTSDHGNVFGKYGVFFGHPPRTYLPELVEIPWFEIKDKKSFKF